MYKMVSLTSLFSSHTPKRRSIMMQAIWPSNKATDITFNFDMRIVCYNIHVYSLKAGLWWLGDPKGLRVMFCSGSKSHGFEPYSHQTWQWVILSKLDLTKRKCTWNLSGLNSFVGMKYSACDPELMSILVTSNLGYAVHLSKADLKNIYIIIITDRIHVQWLYSDPYLYAIANIMMLLITHTSIYLVQLNEYCLIQCCALLSCTCYWLPFATIFWYCYYPAINSAAHASRMDLLSQALHSSSDHTQGLFTTNKLAALGITGGWVVPIVLSS